jgi:hypothetical protein
MRIRHLLLPVAGGCALLALAACRKHGPVVPPEPGPTERLLVVDGLVVTFGDLQPYADFLARYRSDAGRRTLLSAVLDDYMLPLLLARRAFPEERRQQLEKAQGLCSVAGNAIELEQYGKDLGLPKSVTVGRVEVPTAMFLFDEMKKGSVSPPIELPWGYVVCAALDLHRASVAVDDVCDAFMVGFTTHDRANWDAWLAGERQRVARKLTWVHPAYRELLPHWLKAP